MILPQPEKSLKDLKNIIFRRHTCMHFQTSIWRKKYYFSYVIDYILLSLLLDVLSETNETFQNCSQFKPSALVQFISRYMQNRFEILLSAVYLHYKPTLSAEKHFKTIHYIKSKFYAIKFQINWIALVLGAVQGSKKHHFNWFEHILKELVISSWENVRITFFFLMKAVNTFHSSI